jgi:hypothetical protein
MGEANSACMPTVAPWWTLALRPLPSTAGVRSIVQLGRTFGLVTWSLEIDGVKTKAYRDTAGLGWKGSLPSSAGLPSIARQQRQRATWPSFAYYSTWHSARRGSDVGSQGS